MAIHPRISFHTIRMTRISLAEAITFAAREGIAAVGCMADALDDDARDALAGSDVALAYVTATSQFTLDAPDRWPGERQALDATLRAAASAGAEAVYMVTGPAGALKRLANTRKLASTCTPSAAMASSSRSSLSRSRDGTHVPRSTCCMIRLVSSSAPPLRREPSKADLRAERRVPVDDMAHRLRSGVAQRGHTDTTPLMYESIVPAHPM